jgi:ABC-type multidrug transport system permease subunit
MVGRSLADATLVVWGIFVTGIVGLLVGFRTHAPIGRVLIGIVLMAIAGYAFTWVFITMGLVSANAQAAQGLSMLVIPFSFVSTANVPVETMPGWMQAFARNQPVSAVINAVRCLFQGREHVVGIGHSTTYWLVLSLVWCAGICLVFGTLAVRRFGKMR